MLNFVKRDASGPSRRARRANGTVAQLVAKAPSHTWLPETKKQNEKKDRGNRGRNIHERRTVKVAYQELGNCERKSGNQTRWPDLPHAFSAGHGPNQPERDNQREDRQLPPNHRTQGVQRKASYTCQSNDRCTKSAKRHRRRIADERKARGRQRSETQADQHGRTNSHRSAESGGALDKGSEAKSNKQCLNTAVTGQPGNGLFYHLKFSSHDRQVVGKDRI